MSCVKIEDLNVERNLEETESAGIVGGGYRRRRSYGHGNSHGNSHSPWGYNRSRFNHYPSYSHGGYYGGYNSGHYGGYNGGHRRGHGNFYGNRHGGFQMNLGHGFGFGAYGNH